MWNPSEENEGLQREARTRPNRGESSLLILVSGRGNDGLQTSGETQRRSKAASIDQNEGGERMAGTNNSAIAIVVKIGKL